MLYYAAGPCGLACESLTFEFASYEAALEDVLGGATELSRAAFELPYVASSIRRTHEIVNAFSGVRTLEESAFAFRTMKAVRRRGPTDEGLSSRTSEVRRTLEVVIQTLELVHTREVVEGVAREYPDGASELVIVIIVIAAAEGVTRFAITASVDVGLLPTAVEEIIAFMNIPAIESVRAAVSVSAMILVYLGAVAASEVVLNA